MRDTIKLSPGAEVVTLAKATADSPVHIREKSEEWTLCGRDARGAQALPKFNENWLYPLDPDGRVCRTCLRGANRRTDILAK